MTCQNGLCSPGEPEAIFDPDLLGEWTAIDPKPQKGEEGYFKVERDAAGSKAYRVSVISLTDGRRAREPYVFKAYLSKLGDSFFLDAVSAPKPGRQKEAPKHDIWRIKIKMPEITVWALSEEFVKGHPNAIPSEVASSPLGIESVLVTATTRELSDFVREYAHNEAAWNGARLVLRHR